jgi:hypothetical protein
MYIREAGDLLDVTKSLAPDKKDAKHILEHIILQLIEFKKFNPVSVFEKKEENWRGKNLRKNNEEKIPQIPSKILKNLLELPKISKLTLTFLGIHGYS